ncbi:MAG: hypothetical protein ACOYIO_06580 [Eubacteriales bacterium]
MVGEKDKLFQLMQNPPIKKSFFQRTTTSTSHYTKANEQSRFLSATTYCELAVHLFFFAKTSVLRQQYSHPFAPIQSLYAGVLQAKPVSARATGNFCEVSFGRALNRGSQGFAVSLKHGRLAHVRSQFSLFRRSPTHKNLPPATFCTSERAFWLLFARRKKHEKRSFRRKLRGFANLKSAHQNNSFAPQQLKPF